MEQPLGLRPWLGLCVLAFACALSGCGPTGRDGPALASDAAADDAAAATADVAGDPVDLGPFGGATGPCDRYRRESCPPDSLCLLRMGALSCVAYGSVGGPCWPDNHCDPGARCNPWSGTCVTPTAVGAECNSYDGPCEDGSSCRYPIDQETRRCLPNGSPGGYCDAAGATCEAGLRCTATGDSWSRCLPTVAPGERCDVAANRSTCAEGSRCLAGADIYRCIADGAELSLCGTAGATCDPGLRCSEGRCRRPLALGDSCGLIDVGGVCPADSSCVDPFGSGRCLALGAAGSTCRSAAPWCDADLECSSVGGYEPGFCRRVVAEGGACDVAQRSTRCAVATTCAPDLWGVIGVCARSGTLAGAPCRYDFPRCDGALECSSSRTLHAPTCRRIVPVGAPCDVATEAVVCEGAARCVPLDGVGVCTLDTPEVEPNDDAVSAQVVTANPVAIAGFVESGRRDCFAVTTVANASILVIAPAGYGEYPPTFVTLLDDTGAEVARSWTVTPGFDPARDPEARGLEAGRHVVCIGTSSFSGNLYRLILSVTTPSP